jgi:hypothetical protein
MRKKLLSMLALLCLTVSGAWADADVTWNSSNVSDIQFWGGAPDGWDSYTKEGVTLRGNAEQCDAVWANYGDGDGINFNMNASGGYTFTAPDGKKFTKIEMTIYSYDGWYDKADDNQLGSGWPSGYDAAMTIYYTNKVTWTGDATSTVDLLTDAGLSSFGGATVSSIEFYFEAPAGPTVVASGNCGTSGHESDVTWSLTDDGTLTISGTGAMADYTAADGQPWYSSASDITSIVVEAGVTHIGNNSFRNFTNMTSVTLPEGLESIGNHAFNGCTNASFTSITIPASVTSTGTYIFNGCTNLATVEFSAGSNLTGIGDYAFQSCTSLGSITIPAGVTSIGNNAFQSCISLGSINIPASVTSIGNYAFDGCTNLTSITLNSNPYLGGTSVYTGGATVTMNLTANGPVDEKYWMTFYNQRYNFVADENTQVFKAELSGTSITLHEVTDRIVTKAKAVILKSTGNPVMTKTADTSSNEDANSLRGVMSSSGMTVTTDPSTFYVLNYTAANGVGFYKLASGSKLEAYKAYLLYDGGGAGARAFIGFDEATSIEGVSVNENFENGEVYDLQGRRVVNPTKGLYIVNGKKVFINK